MRTYTVKAGDTLGDIAQRELGDRSKWPLIYNANLRLIAEDNRSKMLRAASLRGQYTQPSHWIFPGQVLRIPGWP